MPTLLLAHGNPSEAEPIAQALERAGWNVVRKVDALGALAACEKGNLAAALVCDPLVDTSGFELATLLHQAHGALSVVMLARMDSPLLEPHRASPTAARAYLDRALPPERIASELLQSVRVLIPNARPGSGALAVAAAMRELDGMNASARPPTPEGIARAEPPSELEAQAKRARELELEKLVLQREIEKQQKSHARALEARDEMVRHLELALTALTGDLSNAAVGLAEQQDRAGALNAEAKQVGAQLAAEVSLSHEQRKEISELKAALLASELDSLALREALERAMTEAHQSFRRALEAEAQRSDLIRAVNTARERIEQLVALRDTHERDAANQDEQVSRLREKLQRAESALDSPKGSARKLSG